MAHLTQKGYVLEHHPGHHRANKSGFVLAHIIAYERYTGTKVPDGFVIHHINGIKTDNSPENLKMMPTGEHSKLHNKLRRHSEETKSKISAKTKARLSDPSMHPRFLPLDIEAIKEDRTLGLGVKQICQKYGISKYTYYARITGYRRKK